MRVLHVISGIDPAIGGPVAALVGWAEAQVRVGLDVTVVSSWTRGQDTSLADRLRSRGVKVELVGPAIRRLGTWHRANRSTLRTLVRHVDVVHIHALWEDIQHQAARVARRTGVPYVITPHGMLDRWSLSQSRLKKRAYMLLRLRANLRHAALLHFTTEAERRSAAEGNEFAAPTLVEPLGVDLTEFQTLPAPGTFRDRHARLAGRPFVVFLGRIHRGKGLEYLVPVMAKVQPPDVMLVIVGPDSNGYRAEIERLVSEHGLGDRVLFTGMLRGPDRVAALADADLFCLPSDHENFGMSVVEALAAGTPVVISDQVNLHDQVTAAGVGGAVPCDVNLLSAELGRWLQDDLMRRAAGGKARDFVWQRYDSVEVARRWVGHYQRLMSAVGTPMERVPSPSTAESVPRTAGPGRSA